MMDGRPSILHSGSSSASPFEFRENCELQLPRDWKRLLPPFSPAGSSLSTHSTQSSSSSCDVSPTPPISEPHNRTKQGIQRPIDTVLTSVRARSLSADASEASGYQPVSRTPQLNGKQQGTSYIGCQVALPCPGSELVTISETSNQPKADKELPIYLPRRFEFCRVEDMVELISQMLDELIVVNDLHPVTSGGATRFHSRTAPSISVRDYLNRFAVHAALVPSLLLAMVCYADRLCALYEGFSINSLTVHRFLVAAATVAAKGLSDGFCRNNTYARIGGVTARELKTLELELLYRLDWRILPDYEDLRAYYHGLVERMAEYKLEPAATKR